MAANTAALNPKEFAIYIAEETTAGTIASGAAFIGIEVESISMPTFNDMRITEQRSGSDGRVVNSNDLQRHEPGAVHEISISGILTIANAPIILESAFGKEIASATLGAETANFLTLASGYEHTSFLHGATGGGQNTVSILIQGHSVVNSTYKMKGCVVTSLTINADSQDNGGRFTFDMTAQTRSPITDAPAAREASVTDYTNDFIYLGDFTETKVVMDEDVILDAFSLTAENPCAFLGNKSSGASVLPESYLRGIPNLNVTANCVVKFDAAVNDFFELSRTMAVASTNALFLSNNATFASGTAFGINIPKAFIEEVSYDESDYLKLNVTMKMVDGGSGNLIMIRKPA